MLTTSEWTKLMVFQKEIQDLKFRKTLNNKEIIEDFLNDEVKILNEKQNTK